MAAILAVVLGGVGLSGVLGSNTPKTVVMEDDLNPYPNSIMNVNGMKGAWMPKSVPVQAIWQYAPYQSFYMREGCVHRYSPISMKLMDEPMF